MQEQPEKEISPDVDGSPPMDMEALTWAIREMNVLRKNLLIYPPGHVQVDNSLTRAHHCLVDLLKGPKDLVLGIANGTLLFHETVLGANNPIILDLASSFKKHGMVGLTFSEGLEKEELSRFFELIVQLPDDIKKQGGLEKIINTEPSSHIKIKLADFSQLHVTEEKEISQRDDETAENFFNWMVSGITF